MHTREEKREELCSEICDFRDRLLEKFGEDEVYTSLLWISSLMFLRSSNNLSRQKQKLLEQPMLLMAKSWIDEIKKSYLRQR